MLIISEKEAIRLEQMGIKVGRFILGCLEDERLQKLLEELNINYGQIAQEEINFLRSDAPNHPVKGKVQHLFSTLTQRVTSTGRH